MCCVILKEYFAAGLVGWTCPVAATNASSPATLENVWMRPDKRSVPNPAPKSDLDVVILATLLVTMDHVPALLAMKRYQ